MDYCQADLRSYLADVAALDKIDSVSKQVSLDTEIPALCSAARRPLLFNNIAGYPGWRLVDALLTNRTHQAIALNSKPDRVMQDYAACLLKGPGETVQIATGPVKETLWLGKDADLTRLPAATPSEGIEVPHLNLKPSDFHIPTISGAIIITKERGANIHNCSYSMVQVAGPQRGQCYLLSSHTWRNIESYQAYNEPIPMAMVIGCHPAYELAAVYTGPHPGFSELHMAAALLGKPVPLVNCETIDMQVPAYAEIVIEGYLDPNPGPYIHTSAHTDTHSPIIGEEIFFDVTAISMRKDPIYRHIQPTRFTDHHGICEFYIAPLLYNMLRSKGINVHDVAVPMHSAINCAAIQMTATCREEVRDALLTALSMPFLPRMVIAVDQDVNIQDTNELIYALSIRADPAKDIIVLENMRSFDLEPLGELIPGLEKTKLRSGSRWGIDATKPPLNKPEQRIQFERLRARGEGKVSLKDFVDPPH